VFFRYVALCEIGKATQSQAEAFVDTWTWGPEAAWAYDMVLSSPSGAARMLKALAWRAGGQNG
jgi:hypothetical protein